MLYNAYQGSCGPGKRKCKVKGKSNRDPLFGGNKTKGKSVKLKKTTTPPPEIEPETGSHVNPNRMQGARKTTVPSSGIGDKKQYDKFSSEKYKTRKSTKRVTVKLPTQG